jgi:hypothetical protein
VKRRHLVGAAGIAAILAAGSALFCSLWTPQIVAYRHEAPGSAKVVVKGTPSAAFILSGDAVPESITAASVNHAAVTKAWSAALAGTHRIFRLTTAFTAPFSEGQSSANGEQNHVLVLYPLGCSWLGAPIVTALQKVSVCQSAGYAEIIRQSPAFLMSRYGFAKPDGYSILGRRTIGVPEAEVKRSAEIIGVGGGQLLRVPELAAEVAAGIGNAPFELKQAARLIALMNEKPVRVGPSETKPDASRDAVERLSALHDGDAAVQCQGFRDIWLELAVRMPGIERVRPVSAYNYFPTFADLVTFSHALAEIHLRDEGRWILIDPWYGFALR